MGKGAVFVETMRAAFYTLGCKVNQYESQVLAQRFAQEGYDIVEPHESADLYVVNSCTVTATSDKKTRQIIHRLHRQNPQAIIALCGCFSQAYAQEAAAIPEVSILAGSGNKMALPALVARFRQEGEKLIDIPPHRQGEAFEPMEAQRFLERTRAFVKIQDGCERYCSYCAIPYARGFDRSKPLEDLRRELELLSRNGYKEVVLVGIDLSSYGKDLGLRLIDAVVTACQVPGIARVRLGSLEPALFTLEDYRRLAALPQFCPQFHLALQSGCDATLRRMNRHYDSAFFRSIVKTIRENFENPSITTDIMVGFPGETEEEFAESLRFSQEMAFAKAHIFAYSPRQGTRAARMEGQVPNAVKEARSRRLSAAMEEIRESFLLSQVGLREEVLLESREAGGWVGYTKNYSPVLLQDPRDLGGQLLTVELYASDGQHCLARLAEK